MTITARRAVAVFITIILCVLILRLVGEAFDEQLTDCIEVTRDPEWCHAQ